MFANTTDRAAFIDRIVLNLWPPDISGGTLRQKLEDQKSVPILRTGKTYSWCVSGKWGLTGNSIAIVYGRVKKFPNVPTAQISFRSEAVPLTGAQVVVAITELFGAGTNVDISMLELTFDTERTPWWRLRQEVVHRARSWRELSDVARRRRTLYVGSRASDVQTRIYQKTDTLVRLEFVLRRGYLRPLGVTQPLDVVRLRAGQVWRLLSLRSCSGARVWAATGSWRNRTGRKIMREWRQRGLPNQLLATTLREGGVDPSGALIKSRQQLLFEGMLRDLTW